MPDLENLYRLQVRHVREYAIFFIDLEGIIQTWNEGVELVLGYSESEWVGGHTSMIFTPPDKAAALFEAEMDIARAEGRASDVRWHKKKDGTEFYANGIVETIFDDAGRLIGYTKVVSDETGRKKVEDSLLAANTALEHFAYAASHDLQEPLRTIGSYAQLLLRRYGSKFDENACDYLTFITGAVGRMSHLVQSLLAYARIGVNTSVRTVLSLDEDVEAAISQLTSTIAEAGANVSHDPLPTVEAEHDQVVRLLQNLISNAVKYRSNDRQPVIHISAARRDSDWVITVADNGQGFSQQHAENIFKPFTRLHGPEYAGSGVGLTICRRIAEAQGGTIWAESQPGEGSRFSFTLPRSTTDL